MQLPYRFRLYKIACITNLLAMGCMLLLMVWLLTNKGNHFSPGAGLLLVVAFFIINYKNDKIGLQLFTQAQFGKPVPKRQRNSIKIFWMIQIILQAIIGFQLLGTIKKYFLILSNGNHFYWLNASGIISDILGFLCFTTALTTIVLVWPLVKFTHRQYVALNRLKKPESQTLLEIFEPFADKR
jgi:hypothetical protein